MNPDSDNPVQLNLLATELLERGSVEEAARVLLRALQRKQDYAEAHYNLGRVHRAAGRPDLARNSFLSALALEPGFADAALGLGQACYDLGRSEEALQHLERALQADPDNAAALCCCGQALADMGHVELSLRFLRRAIETAPGELGHSRAAIGVLQRIEFVAENPWFERFVVGCFDDPRLTHASLTNVATSLLWVKPVVQAAVAADRLDASQLAGLALEPLLMRLLSGAIVQSWAFEQLYTKLRATLTALRDPAHLELMAGVAEQAFNAGYVQYQSEDEAALERELLKKDVASLTAVELMVLAAYRPLVDVPGAPDVDLPADSPDAVRRVIRRTLLEPLREREIRTQIVCLTPIVDEVSKRVQAQYEEDPYPRWIDFQPADDRKARLVDVLAKHAANFSDPGWPERPQALVPGCGTGYHPLSLAGRYPETDVLAVDLSRASLAYAIRRQAELELTNVRFCQADLLGLDQLDARFEYIDCAGVLHHLESPMDGWRVLTKLLKPGGVMRIGLYSEAARGTIVAAREKIAAMRIPSTASAIRAFRQSIMSNADLSELRSLAGATADFFSMGGIRDLIFHVQETRFDLPTVRQCLDDLGLGFGGFILEDRDVARQFHALYPAKAQWLDLECWAEFEARYPNTFFRMYQFYCLRPVESR